MRQRLWSEHGIGLVELLIAMAVLQIAVFALVAALSSGHVATLRASKISTASAVANAQIENYRALKFAAIPTSSTTTSYNSGDQDIEGPDGRWYRYRITIAYVPATGTSRELKRLTITVRETANPSGAALVTQETLFSDVTG
jgi:type II secretory pathway pseudopilin PulG